MSTLLPKNGAEDKGSSIVDIISKLSGTVMNAVFSNISSNICNQEDLLIVFQKTLHESLSTTACTKSLWETNLFTSDTGDPELLISLQDIIEEKLKQLKIVNEEEVIKAIRKNAMFILEKEYVSK